MRQQGPGSRLREAVGRDKKGKVSLACYAVAIPGALVHPWLAGVLFLAVAALWLVPDRRIEARLDGHGS